MDCESEGEYSYDIHENIHEYSSASRDIHETFMKLLFFGEPLDLFREQ